MSTPEPVDERRLVSARLLTELVSATLDPGYQAAARRRAGRPRPRYETALAAFGCLLLGFVAVVGYVHTHRAAPEGAVVHTRLVQRVRQAERDGTTLQATLSTLARKLAASRNAALPQSGALARQLARQQLAAGAVAVRGPGLVVTLTDAPTTPRSAAPRAGTVPIGSGSILTDRDVRSVADELWHDGAEAIAVNGVRLTPTSAIRFAGQAVLVDLQPVTSPYTISAIGDADRLATSFAQSAVASRYLTLRGADGIGFRFADRTSIRLPAGSPASPRYARTASR